MTLFQVSVHLSFHNPKATCYFVSGIFNEEKESLSKRRGKIMFSDIYSFQACGINPVEVSPKDKLCILFIGILELQQE